MTIGNQLRDARVRLGRSREQISHATKIQPRKIIALEEDAFDQLPTGIYLDGIVAAYAREVGCDPEAMVRRLRADMAPPPPETLEGIVAVRQSPERSSWEFSLGLGHSMLAFAGVVLLLAIAGVGVQFYPLQSGGDSQRAAGARRSGSVPRIEKVAPTPVAESVVVAEAPQPPLPVRNLPMGAQAPSLAVTEPVPVAPDSTLEGTWALATEVESSSLRMYEGLRLEYRVELRQIGGEIEGTGRKISENGVLLTGKRQTPIAVRGRLDGGHLKLTFGERGTRRSSRGTFDLLVEDSGVLRGSFASDAARSAGVVEARRL